MTTPYDYHRPKTLADAWRLFGETPGARFIAGGTDLMVRLREGKATPRALVSLGGVTELAGIEVGETTRIGALTRVSDLLAHRALAEAFPALVTAARTLGSVQIRNLATAGGNLCNASPCADLAPPLLVLGARVRIESSAGVREIPLEDFFVAPGQTRLAPGEVLTAILVDQPPPGTRTSFIKKGRVRMDISITSIAVAIEVSGTKCTKARIAAGSVGPRPMRLPRTEKLLEGRDLTPGVLREARARASEEVTPITDVRATEAYRRHLAGVLVERAVASLLSGAEGSFR